MPLRSWMLAAALATSLCVSTVIAQTASITQPVERARLADILQLDGELFHVQGIDLDERSLWVTSVNLVSHRGYLHQFDRRTGKFERRVELTDGERYHPGGISLHGNAIWVPVAENRPKSTAVIEEIDRKTLAVKRKIAVADHIGCVTVSGNNRIIAGNWDSRLFYILDAQGRKLRTMPNPSETRYQDIKFVRGQLVGSGYLTPLSGTIDWISWPSMKIIDARHAGATDRQKPYTGEGMTLKGPDLFLLSEDGPSRLFRFRLSK